MDEPVTGAAWLRSVVLTPAAAASQVDVRDGSGAPVRLTLKAPANGASAIWASRSPNGVPFSSSIHATISGASATAAFEFD